MAWPSRRHLPWLLLAAVVSLPALLPCLQGRVFLYRDLVEFFLPMKVFLHDRLWAGELPLWDPYTYCGRPFFATLQSQVLYPPNLIACIFPMPLAFGPFAAFHLVMAALGMHLWARRLGLRSASAWIAGAGYGLGGPLLATVEVSNNLSTMTWWPWIGWAASGLASRATPQAFLSLVLALSLAGLGGEPHLALFGGFLSVATVFALPAKRDGDPRDTPTSRRARLVVLAGVLAVGLILVQVLPFLELVSQSDRSRGLEAEAATKHSATWSDITGYLQGNRRNFSVSPDDLQTARHRQGYIRLRYAGALGVALALIGLAAGLRCQSRSVRRLTWFGFGVLAVSWGLALGASSPLFSLARLSGVLYSFRYPAKFLVPASLGLALLAAVGIELLLREERAWLRPFALTLLPIVGLCSLVAGGSALATGWVGAATAWIGLLVYLLRKNWTAPALCALLAVDLLAAHVGVLPTGDAGELYAPTDVSSLVTAQAGAELSTRIYTRPESVEKVLAAWPGTAAPEGQLEKFARNRVIQLAGNVPMALGVRTVRGGAALTPARIQSVLDRADRGGRDRESLQALNRLGIAYVLSYGTLHHPAFPQRENRHLPESAGFLYRFSGPACHIGLVEAAFVSASAEHDPVGHGRPIQTDGVHCDPECRVGNGGDPNGSCRLFLTSAPQVGNGSFSVELRANEPGYLVVRESWYPGWKAAVDGERAPILLADGAFMAIELESGAKHVELRYLPLTLYLGALGSLTALLSLLLVVRRLRREDSMECPT